MEAEETHDEEEGIAADFDGVGGVVALVEAFVVDLFV